MGNFMIPVCCICKAAAPRWHDAKWEASGGLQDFCPAHAKQHPTLTEYSALLDRLRPAHIEANEMNAPRCMSCSEEIAEDNLGIEWGTRPSPDTLQPGPQCEAT